ncbi:MAG TPA: electron transport complex subunit RsxA, partial [Idiomarina baltica]|nr:electron transport complex subunit RsxA [Idiomarina baltica]
AVGFSLVLILFSGIRERLAAADVPKAFKGSAIAMITAGLMSLAFMGFSGLVTQ